MRVGECTCRRRMNLALGKLGQSHIPSQSWMSRMCEQEIELTKPTHLCECTRTKPRDGGVGADRWYSASVRTSTGPPFCIEQQLHVNTSFTRPLPPPTRMLRWTFGCVCTHQNSGRLLMINGRGWHPWCAPAHMINVFNPAPVNDNYRADAFQRRWIWLNGYISVMQTNFMTNYRKRRRLCGYFYFTGGIC